MELPLENDNFHYEMVDYFAIAGKEHDVPEGSWAHSDHLPVVADFDVAWGDGAAPKL